MQAVNSGKKPTTGVLKLLTKDMAGRGTSEKAVRTGDNKPLICKIAKSATMTIAAASAANVLV